MIKNIYSKITEILSNDSLIRKLLKVIIVFLIILSAFTLCNVDLANWNMVWGKTLLECIRTGKVRDFALILEKNGTPTNYNIVLNLSFSVWEFPIYLIEMITGRVISYYIYAAWYKVLIIIVTIITLKRFRMIIGEIAPVYNRDYYIELCTFLYLLSPVLLLASIGQGQVDFLGNYFFVNAIYAFMKNNFRNMTLWISIALIVKGFALFFYFPVLILVFGKDLFRIFKHIIIAIIPAAISKVLSIVVFKDFKRISDYMSRNLDFTGRVFEESIQYTSLFLLVCVIVCGGCYYISVSGKTKYYHYILSGSIIFIAFAMTINWHPQWWIYCLPIFIIIGCFYNSLESFLIYFLGMNSAFLLLVTSRPGLIDDNKLMETSLLAVFLDFKYQYWYLGHFYEKIFTRYDREVFSSILIGIMILIVWIFYIEASKRPVGSINNPIIEEKEIVSNYRINFLILLQAVPMILFLAASYVIYIHAVMINSR